MLTYNDPIKAKSREKLYEFIKRNLHFKDPKEMKVMCFPGAENKGEEALEVKEVYDRLGIPRENIYGVEYSYKKAKRLEKSNLGIKVYNIDAIDFFKETEEKFDIISLDYTGNFGDSEFQTLQEIIFNRCLNKNSILATNFFGARENLRTQISLLLESSLAGHCYGDDTQFKNLDETLTNLITKENKPDLSKIRDGISVTIYGLLGSGKYCKGITEDHILFKSPVKDVADSRLKSIIQKTLDNKDETRERLEEIIKQNKSIGLTTISEVAGLPLHSHGNLWANIQRQTLSEYLSKVLNCDFNIAKGLVYLLEARYSGGHFMEENKRYRYISNKNCPMIMDLFYVRSYDNVLKNIDSIFSINPEGVNFNPFKISSSRLNTILRQILRYIDNSIGIKFPEREFLGGSYNRERLSREELIYLIESGVPSEEILETYPRHKKMEIAGVKAWLTRHPKD